MEQHGQVLKNLKLLLIMPLLMSDISHKEREKTLIQRLFYRYLLIM